MLTYGHEVSDDAASKRRQRLTWLICMLALSSADLSNARNRSTSFVRAFFSTETDARRVLRMSSWSLLTRVTETVARGSARGKARVGESESTHDPTLRR